MSKNEPKVLTAEELVSKAQERLKNAVWYEIPEWGGKVKIAPASLQQFFEIVNDMRFHAQHQPGAKADVAVQLAWIRACLVEPQLTNEQVQKLAEADARVVRDLSLKCQVVSGNLDESFDPEVMRLKAGSEQTDEDTSPSTPPA